MEKSQKQRVIERLKETGEVTRNWALSQYISRLGAIACDLGHSGWELEAFSRDGDYVYKLIKPAQRMVMEYDLRDGIRYPRVIYKSV